MPKSSSTSHLRFIDSVGRLWTFLQVSTFTRNNLSILIRNLNLSSKDWMDLARYSKEYIDGVESFLDFAYSFGDPQGYTRWINHGEWDVKLNIDDDMDYSRDDIDGLLNDQFRDVANDSSSLKEEMNETREEMRHLFSQLLQNNPRLNVQDIPGFVRSTLVSHVDESNAQAVRGQNLPHFSRSTHDSVLQKGNGGDQI